MSQAARFTVSIEPELLARFDTWIHDQGFANRSQGVRRLFRERLADSEPKVLYAPLPLLHVTGVLAANKDAGAGAYNCPCYKSPKRGGLHFVFDVDLRTEDPPARWILRGVCLLTTKD